MTGACSSSPPGSTIGINDGSADKDIEGNAEASEKLAKAAYPKRVFGLNPANCSKANRLRQSACAVVCFSNSPSQQPRLIHLVFAEELRLQGGECLLARVSIALE